MATFIRGNNLLLPSYNKRVVSDLWKHILLAPTKLYKKITRISILQSSKVVTVLSALSGFICTLIGIPLFVLGGEELKLLAIICILGPMWYAILGFVFFVIFVAIYNLLAKKLGGFEFEVTDVNSAV